MRSTVYNFDTAWQTHLPICFFSASDYHIQRDVCRPDGFAREQILVVLEGMGTLICGGKTLPLRRGSAFFTARNVPMEYLDGGGLVTAFITFRGASVPALTAHYCPEGVLYYESYPATAFADAVREITERYRSEGESGQLSAAVLALVSSFFEYKRENLTVSEEIAAYIQRHFSHKLLLDELAAVAHCSVSKLCHDFKAQFGKTVIAYLLEVRLTAARDLLIDSDKAVKDVAMSCGFEDVGYFCRCYKRAFGHTPSTERR